MSTALVLIQRYLALLEAFELDPAAYTEILHPEYQQTELPNLLNRQGQASSRAEALSRMAMGRKILASQRYEITNHVEQGDQIVVEARWRGTMAMDAGALRAGQELEAWFCIVCELEDGLLRRQRNYDCFAPFDG